MLQPVSGRGLEHIKRIHWVLPTVLAIIVIIVAVVSISIVICAWRGFATVTFPIFVIEVILAVPIITTIFVIVIFY